MSRILRSLLVLTLLFTAHCGDDDSTAATATADTAETCISCLNEFDKNDKKLCPEPQSEWKCVEGCCVPVFKCETDEQCATTGFDEGQCTDDRYDCRCETDTGACYEWLCGTSDECDEDEVCDAGACVAISDALSLRLVSQVHILSPGATGQLLAEAFDPSAPELGLPIDVTWSSEDESVVSVDAEGTVTGGDVAGGDDARALLRERHALRAFGVQTQRQVLDVQDDVRHILADARDGGELMQHAVDLNGGNGRALKRGHQHAAKRVAEGEAEAALERLGDDRRETLRIMARIDFELVRFDKLFPVLLDHVDNLVPSFAERLRAPGGRHPPPDLFNVRSTIQSCERGTWQRARRRANQIPVVRRVAAWAGGNHCAGSASRRGWT